MSIATFRFMALVSSCCLILHLTGCGGSSVATHSVEGTVAIDGKPLDVGQIVFDPISKNIAAAATDIKEGKYLLQASEGEYRVRIMASRKAEGSGPVPGLDGVTVVETRLGPEFNTESKLTARVAPQVNSGIHFDVVELPKK